jgi:hypothetical protein
MFELVSYAVQLDKPGQPVLVNVRARVPFGSRTLEQPVQLVFDRSDLTAIVIDDARPMFDEREVCELIKMKLGADVTPATPQPERAGAAG